MKTKLTKEEMRVIFGGVNPKDCPDGEAAYFCRFPEAVGIFCLSPDYGFQMIENGTCHN
ncbi:hypothetical protein [Mucilaginibacter sp.]|uniref:hypothetical protein n=1 Tax=Mucilaginibacter sp. TaxID=1882438 RepID=UPI003B00AE44